MQNNEDLKLIKERLLSQEKYKQPRYLHRLRIYQFADYANLDDEIYPEKKDIDVNGDTLYLNQSWELSFNNPASIEIMIRENTATDDVIRLLQKAIYNIRNSKDSLAVDYQQRNQLLDSIKAQSE
ncbi:MAG: hypothetical protein Q7T96_00930 [Methylobacter sp.]|nr:hypothetical protein [Methylobacter sp.]